MGNRIAVSTEFIRPGKVGGAEQMTYSVLDGLLQALGEDDELVIYGDVPDLKSPQGERVSPPAVKLNRFFQEKATFRAYADEVDAWLFPNYHTPGGRRDCRVVTVIHDLQYQHYPQNFSLQKRLWLAHALKATLRRADRVVALTEFVRRDLLETFGDRFEEKIVRIPNPVSWERMEGADARPQANPYVLSVAAHYRHKNLSTLIRAFAQIHSARPDLKLVLVGQFAKNLIGVRVAEDVLALIRNLGLETCVITTGYVGNWELGNWYRHAEAFAFPSLFEGFGIPVVEALGFGLPVITTQCASIPEVTLGQAIYLKDPLDVSQMAFQILDVLDHRTRYLPSPDTVENIRAVYSHARIGQMYYETLVG